MGLKIAISGKGGVGKTTLASLIARGLAHRGKRVIAVDADPVTNLAAALGISDDAMPTPISEMKDLIAERTGTEPGKFGGFFKMNPKVDDIPEKYAAENKEKVKLLVMGSVEKGGGGCVCPESVLLKNLIQHLLLSKDDAVIMDMEAGVEHLGRATSRAVNALLVVVDAGSRSHYAAKKIKQLAADIGVTKILILGNRMAEGDEEAMRKALEGFEFLGFFPEDNHVRESDRSAALPYPDISKAPAALWTIVDGLMNL